MKPNTSEQLKRYYSAWRAMNAIYEDWAKKYGLSYYELLVLLSLREGPLRGDASDMCMP